VSAYAEWAYGLRVAKASAFKLFASLTRGLKPVRLRKSLGRATQLCISIHISINLEVIYLDREHDFAVV